jgi:hypothetical protein
MKHQLLLTLTAAGALVVAAALPALGHHSFSAEFDSTKPVTLEGEVDRMEWVNPHSWLYIDIKKADGTIEKWAVEGGSPSVLFRNGWKRDSLPKGTKIKVEGFRSKDGSLRANSRSITFPDGRKLSTGSSFENEKKQ